VSRERRSRSRSAGGLEEENLLVRLAYAVLWGEHRLPQAQSRLAQHPELPQLTREEMQLALDVAESGMDELPGLAYPLAALGCQAARERGEAGLTGRFALVQGTLDWRRDNPAGAIPLLREAADLCRRAGDAEGETIALGNLGNAYFAQEQWDEAIDCYQRLLGVSVTTGNRLLAAMGHLNLGNTFHVQGNLDAAIEAYRQGTEAARDANDPALERACQEKLRDALLERAGRRAG
jgi:tetratricopeptide (TPR) repeat protein